MAPLLCLNLAAQDCASIIAGSDTVGVCPGSTLIFDASGSLGSIGGEITTYQWLFSDGTTSSAPVFARTYDHPGFNQAQLIIADNSGCSDTSSVLIQVSPWADLSFDVDDTQCLGDTFSITTTSSLHPLYHYIIAPTLLPDLDTTTFSMEVDQFPADATITAGTDIATICVDMEHSYMGDLVIQLTCPNGHTLIMHQGGGGGTYLGLPVDDDNPSPLPGGCWYYCWSSSTTSGTWEESAEYGTTPNLTYFGDDASLQAGTYRSVNSFDDLIGCPLNGTWTLAIGDRDGSDNGYSCGWNIQFAGQPFQGPDTNNVTILEPHVGWSCDSLSWQGPGIYANDASCSTVHAVADTPGSNVYTLTVVDDHGCTSSNSTTVEVLHFDPHISGPTWPPFGIPVDYSVEVSPGSPSYFWTSSTASVYFFTLPNAQASWTTSENSWIAVKEYTSRCIGTDTLFIEGLTEIPVEPVEYLVAYPNPANDVLTVPSTVAPSGQLLLRIIDPIGRSTSGRSITNLARPFQLDTRAIPTGTYILEMEGSDEIRTFPFMVVH